jgi:hypothetical protein
LVYRPALLGAARLHFVEAKSGVDEWQNVLLIANLDDGVPDAAWDHAQLADSVDTSDAPEKGAVFAELPAALLRGASYAAWKKDLSAFLYRGHSLTLWKCPALKETSSPGETESDFRIRLQQRAREARDAAVDKLRDRYGPKAETLKSQIRRAEQRVEREQSQRNQHAMQTAISFGKSLLGAVFGRKLSSRSNIGNASSTMRTAGRTAQEQGDVARAEQDVAALRRKLEDLETEFQSEVASLEIAGASDRLELTEYPIRPRKADIAVTKVALVWTPWRVTPEGIAESLTSAT